MAATETIRRLADRIRTLEASFRPCDPAAIPLASSGLGALFPREGLATGSLIELFAQSPGAGTWTLAILLARHACGERKTLFVTDVERSFYPPAARKFGLAPERTIVIHPRKPSEALLALTQALRCPAIGAAVGAFERLADRDARRLQLAAEAGGTLGILARPAAALRSPSFAAVRWLLTPMPSVRNQRRLRVEVLRCRSDVCGFALAEKRQADRHLEANAKPQAACLEINDATGHVRLLSSLELAADLAATA